MKKNMKVVIADCLTSIKDEAFTGCEDLTSVIINADTLPN